MGEKVVTSRVLVRHTRVNLYFPLKAPYTPNQTDLIKHGSPHCSPGAGFARRGVRDA